MLGAPMALRSDAFASQRRSRGPRAGDCARAIERADQFVPGTRLDRWLFAILRSIWLNEIRARRVREGGGFVDAEDALSTDGAHLIETNILAAEVLKAIGRLPEAHRETVLLVYGEGYSYAEAAKALEIPIGTVLSRLAAARAALAKLEIGAFDGR
jgi:RNA polymerase sigma-70 factor (ECF subfamily)